MGVCMATITIRRVPDDVIGRIKESAARRGHSMEEEVRELLRQRYAERAETVARMRGRWSKLNSPSAEDIESWIGTGRD